jgi:LmbE family N-acetylglucosaminyl deacetylase
MNLFRCRMFRSLFVLGLIATQKMDVHAADLKQGAALLKVDVMAILAHPDDETGMATALASLALNEGATVANIYCTRGEGGGNMVGTHWGPSLGVLREAELRDCLNRLGVRYCFFLDQRDWAYTESMSATLGAWDRDVALNRLVRYIRSMRPEIILTMNPTPNPGQHGHHQSAAILATEAFVAAADPSRYPEQISKEGLKIWQPRKLYSTGSLSEYGVEVSGAQQVGNVSLASVVGEALSNHRSQGFGRMLGAPWLNRSRHFSLIKAVTPFRTEKSFFDGLPVEGLTPSLVPPPARGNRGGQNAVHARLIPRPAITRYEEWVKALDVEHIAMEFLPDIPVIEGEKNEIFIEVINPFESPQRASVSLFGGPGIEFDAMQMTNSFSPGVSKIPFIVMPTTGGDHKIRIEVRCNEMTSESQALLHTVPSTRIHWVDSIPGADSSQMDGKGFAPLEIGAAQRVQGKIDSEDDSRAEVWLAHDGEQMSVEVRVWDDSVVSNIAAGDIRGHWRSDSVEICIDPDGGAEDSFGCYKIGIFPFVEGLGAKAARDADANQGPIEETAPGTQVVSKRLIDGYWVKAIIPLSEVGIVPNGEDFFGFNVIIYDGDKKDAAIGENINESRIAWSARSGVQGRPEDWGRIRFEMGESRR